MNIASLLIIGLLIGTAGFLLDQPWLISMGLGVMTGVALRAFSMRFEESREQQPLRESPSSSFFPKDLLHSSIATQH